MRAPRMAAMIVGLIAAAAHAVDVYPSETYPSTSTINALNGTVDSATGLAFIPFQASPSSNPPLRTQIDRRFDREVKILAAWSQGRVVATATNRIGVFPLDYTLNGARAHYAGGTGLGATPFASNGTYYVYIDAANALQIVASGTGWPADITQYVPLAEVVIASAAVSSITDRRPWCAFTVPQSGGTGISGTDSAFFIIDQDNAGAAADTELRANRGSTAGDAALKATGSTRNWTLYADRDVPTYGTLTAKSFTSNVSTGTAPLAITSTTMVSNLNADLWHGVSLTAPAAANGIAYSTSTTAAAWTGAASAGNVLYANGSAVPTWGAIGTTSGVQAYDADLDALAAVSSSGLLARTGSGTASARTLTGSGAIAVANGDGVSANPTISISGMTDGGAVYGNSGGGISSTAAGTDNTVLVGRTGSTPTFRKLVQADVDTTARLELAKLERGTSAQVAVCDGSGVPTYRSLAGDVGVDSSGNTTDTAAPTWTVGTESGDAILVTGRLKTGSGAYVSGKHLVRVWVSDAAGDVEGPTTPSAGTSVDTGTPALQTVTADLGWWIITNTSGEFKIELDHSGGHTFYMQVSYKDAIYSSPAITFAP